MSDTQNYSRRQFLKRTGQLALTGAALPFAMNLAAIGEAAAFNAQAGDYKALVCVFLKGGNDYANTVVPYDLTSYNKYYASRSDIAHPRNALSNTVLVPDQIPLDSITNSPLQFALHPNLVDVANLFNSGNVAVQLNVGSLVTPLTLAQFKSADRITYPIPPHLGSHNDQSSFWLTGGPEGRVKGWGGKMGDLTPSSESLFTGLSLANDAVLLAGDSTAPFVINKKAGAMTVDATSGSPFGSSTLPSTILQLIQPTVGNQMLENEYIRTTNRLLEGAQTVASALQSEGDLATQFRSDDLSTQLHMVARLIKARASLGNPRRQVFFVTLGSFDQHGNLLVNHGELMKALNDALYSFYNGMVELGLTNQVTTFTMSEFGRTLASNGDGSDHGWGGHQLMIGGAVAGKNFYGMAPPISITTSSAPEDQWHTGGGRLLPSTSVAQYAATLASWFGVTNAEMPSVVPYINNFGVGAGYPDYPWNLGFLG